MITASVVIPMFNSATFIERCVLAVRSQLSPHDELLLVDDGSTDETLTVATQLIMDDARARVIVLDQNQGVSAARNRGMDEAKGDLILFVDADDEPAETMLDSLRDAIAASNADIVAGGYEVLDECTGKRFSPGIPKRDQVVKGEVALEMLCNRTLASSVCFMAFRREFLGTQRRFRLNLRFEDYIFLAEYLAEADTVAIISEPVYVYRRRTGSETGRLNETVFDVLVGEEVAQRALETLPTTSRRRFLSHRLRVSLHLTVANQAAVFGGNNELTIRAFRAARSGYSLFEIPRVFVRSPSLALRAALLKLSPRLYSIVFRMARTAKSRVNTLGRRQS